MQKAYSAERVVFVSNCKFRTAPGSWAYAAGHSEAIEDNWRRAVADNPQFFNGVIHLIDELSLEDGALNARLLCTDFKSYLFWRKAGLPQAGVLDGFGSALIRSSDGAIVLGRQREGNVNGGLAYLPGGFIDARDVVGDGSVDIAASVARELLEETGLTAPVVKAQPGFIVTQTGAHVSLAVAYEASEDAAALKKRIEDHIGTDPVSELTEVIVIRGLSDLEGLAMPSYARLLLKSLLKDGI
jgi:ADP-ribose pyrophosphatase YjhB (NUDIX family)